MSIAQVLLRFTRAGLAVLILGTSCAACSFDAITARRSDGARSGQNMLDGITVGFTAEGHPFRGSPDAVVTLVEYSDYLCPFCARHATQTAPALTDKYIRTGQAKWVFRDFPIAGLHPTSDKGHMAALCVAEQGAALFWRMHDKLFAEQSQWNQVADPAAYLEQAAKAIGADETAYKGCVASGRTKATVDKGIADAGALGFNGTPSFQLVSSSGATYTVVGAQSLDTFATAIDAMLAGQAPVQPTAVPTQKAELPFWANADGLKPDPKRPGYTMAGDPYKGNPQAKLVVVEFSDFQCPVCQRHALEVQPAIDKQFVDTGEIMWVFKNLPLREHPQAAAAAAASECAGEQGKFWEMYHALFASIDQWTVAGPDAALAKLASGIGVDVGRFAVCLSGRAAMERVLSDVQDAAAVGGSTPTFVVLYAGRGTLLQGTRPADQFTSLLQQMLNEVGTAQ